MTLMNSNEYSKSVSLDYSVDEKGEIVHIKEAVAFRYRGEVQSYYCPDTTCHSPLTIVAGKIRRLHFRHRFEDHHSICSKETREHATAKRIIIRAIEKGEKINLSFTCDKCARYQVHFQIPEFVTIAKEEVRYENTSYRGDVAIYANNQTVPYLMFEVLHSHAVGEVKAQHINNWVEIDSEEILKPDHDNLKIHQWEVRASSRRGPRICESCTDKRNLLQDSSYRINNFYDVFSSAPELITFEDIKGLLGKAKDSGNWWIDSLLIKPLEQLVCAENEEQLATLQLCCDLCPATTYKHYPKWKQKFGARIILSFEEAARVHIKVIDEKNRKREIKRIEAEKKFKQERDKDALYQLQKMQRIEQELNNITVLDDYKQQANEGLYVYPVAIMLEFIKEDRLDFLFEKYSILMTSYVLHKCWVEAFYYNNFRSSNFFGVISKYALLWTDPTILLWVLENSRMQIKSFPESTLDHILGNMNDAHKAKLLKFITTHESPSDFDTLSSKLK